MKLKAVLLIIAGFFLLALGAIGLFVPILPTTPFVLGSAGCFAGSPRLRAMVLKIGFFREYMDNYQRGGGLSKRTVAASLLFLWGMLALSCLLTRTLWLAILLLLIGTAVTVHILWIARKKP